MGEVVQVRGEGGWHWCWGGVDGVGRMGRRRRRDRKGAGLMGGTREWGRGRGRTWLACSVECEGWVRKCMEGARLEHRRQ